MKIAVSGTHRTGKTTLINALADSLPGFSVFEEPYYQLAEEGHEFAEMPCLEDFELQLRRSIESTEDAEGDCLFDRSPYDMIVYLTARDASKASDIEHWLPALGKAVKQLDLIVFVPVEEPDRFEDPDSGDLRRRVNEKLSEIVFDDTWGFGVPVIEVTGTTAERTKQVLEYLAAL